MKPDSRPDPEATPIAVFDLPRKSAGAPRQPRIVPRVRATFVARASEGQAVYRGIDLSAGGLMCACTEPVWPGNSISLLLTLPGERDVVPVRGRVAELVSFGDTIAMRVRFEYVSASARTSIAVWMAKQLQQASSPR